MKYNVLKNAETFHATQYTFLTYKIQWNFVNTHIHTSILFGEEILHK